MNLYSKYRPKTFKDIVGNEVAVSKITNALKKKTHPHAWLLSGPPGTGKTTIARIVASMLGASEMSIFEINTASNRGIDTARDIIDNIRYNSTDAVVYILDECHKFTNDMQNALLKALEEPPEHVYFFLCTTDPQKLIKAVQSRCTKVKTELLTEEQLYSVISRINKLEELKIAKETLKEIAANANGCSRDAIVMLDDISNAANEKEIKAILAGQGAEEDPEIIELCRTLLDSKKGWRDIAIVLKKLKANNKLDEPETVRYMVLGYMNAVLMSHHDVRAAAALEAFSENTYNNGKFGITLACLRTI